MGQINYQETCRILAILDLAVTLVQLILALLILVPVIVNAVTDILFVRTNDIYRDAELISVVELIVLVLTVIAFSSQLWAAQRLLVICNPENRNPKEDVCSSQIYAHVSFICIILQVVSLHRLRGQIISNLFNASVLIFRFVSLYCVNRFRKDLMRQYSAVSISSVIVFPQPEPDEEDVPIYED